MTTTPPTGNDLWDRYFTVKIHYLRSRTIDQVRRYGVRVSGNAEIDRYLRDQEITTQMNIDAMFEKYRMGVTVKVLRYEDTAEIYRIIHHHLIAWAEYMQTGVNVGNAPLKDLIELDIFAGIVYDKAKAVFSEEARDTAISRNFAEVQKLNFHNILVRGPEKQIIRRAADGRDVIIKEPVKIPDRPSMKDLFEKEINQISSWRELGE